MGAFTPSWDNPQESARLSLMPIALGLSTLPGGAEEPTPRARLSSDVAPPPEDQSEGLF